MIQLTDNAREYLSSIANDDHITLGVKGGGCSGFQYDFSFDKKANDDDLKYENILIDKTSADLLKGSEVDYVEELIGNSFVINNPKASSSCGCGLSFSV